ncbi:MAG: hypothetical protein ABI682_16950 [Acidobacteriota bacterium]
MRAAQTRAWLERRFRSAPSEPRVELVAAGIAVVGIFVTIVSVLLEIWWLQGVPMR